MNKIEKALYDKSGRKDWELIDGPQSRCGIDYWFRTLDGSHEACVNDDQGHVEVEINDISLKDTDEED